MQVLNSGRGGAGLQSFGVQVLEMHWASCGSAAGARSPARRHSDVLGNADRSVVEQFLHDGQPVIEVLLHRDAVVIRRLFLLLQTLELAKAWRVPR